MLVLGIDTATRTGSVGVVEVEPEAGAPSVLAERTLETSLRHGETLLGLIDSSLEQAGVSLDRLEGLAVSIGPGSFTGLRVGLATAKGLAFAGGMWIVGVSTLEALAVTLLAEDRSAAMASASPGDLVCACLDARKGEIYRALFTVVEDLSGKRGLRRDVPDAVGTPEALAAELASLSADRTVHFLGDGAERYGDTILGSLGARARVFSLAEAPPRGSIVAELGIDVFRRQGAADLGALTPSYLRRSEAELKRSQASARNAAPVGR